MLKFSKRKKKYILLRTYLTVLAKNIEKKKFAAEVINGEINGLESLKEDIIEKLQKVCYHTRRGKSTMRQINPHTKECEICGETQSTYADWRM